MNSLIRNISVIDPTIRILPHGTLLFFDELQEFPEIATAFKFFAQDGRFDIICSGSLLGTWKGGLFEHIVGEALVKAGIPLAYFKRDNSTLEMDFLARSADCLVPIEVKAENNRSKSLRTLLDRDIYKDIHWGVKLVNGNVGIRSVLGVGLLNDR